tara:strand:- start:201 stop:398 length:198 start_codon:yes stop_codon:yes gene_type:complete
MAGDFTMINAVQQDDVTPFCPHCSQPVQTVNFREISGFLGKRYIYFCQHCRKVLGVTQRKGFWMG